MRVLLGWNNARLLGRSFGERLSTKGSGHEVTKIKHSQGKKFVYPHANEYGTSLERKGELDHITAIRMKCVKKQKRQQKEIKDLAKA